MRYQTAHEACVVVIAFDNFSFYDPAYNDISILYEQLNLSLNRIVRPFTQDMFASHPPYVAAKRHMCFSSYAFKYM